MLDIKLIRENPDLILSGLKAKGATPDIGKILELDRSRRALLQEVESLKSQRNQANDEIARLKKEGKPADEVIASIKTSSQKIKDIDKQVGDIGQDIDKILYSIPNIPHESVPVAPGPKGNKVVRTWGEAGSLPFKGKDHVALCQDLGWVSMDKGAKITGSAFAVFQNRGARLVRALINMMLDLHTKKHGYQEIWPPALVNRNSMTGTGQLPNLEEDMYKLKDDDYFLIPTAEVPLTNLLNGDILEEKDLPVYYTAYSPCFRREAGSYGKDTKGLSRVHQFDKVELVKFVKPEDALEEHEKLTQNAEAVLQALEIPYRVVLLGSGDMSFASSKCYDLEAWAPVSGKWFEVSSCSTFGDFQARRANIRFRRAENRKVEFVHTLNGSGLALPRVILCLLENFQDEKGEVHFPKALLPYLD